MTFRRIGVGTVDGEAVCDHLARSTAFIVLEVEDGRVTSKNVRGRENGECANHATFVEMLEGCDSVICGGIGKGAWDSLLAHGIQPVVASEKHSIDDAVRLYLDGKLATTNRMVCLC